MLLLCFAAFASAAEYGYTVIQYSDAMCTKELKTLTKTTSDDAIGGQLNSDVGICDEEDTVGYMCMAKNILGVYHGGTSCSEGGDYQFLLINQCNTIFGGGSFKLTDLKGCKDKGGTTYYAQFGIYGPGCADADLKHTYSIGTSDKTVGEKLNGDGQLIEGTCMKCSGEGLDFTRYTDDTGCTGTTAWASGEVKIDQCMESTDEKGEKLAIKLISSFGCPSNGRKFGDPGSGTEAAYKASGGGGGGGGDEDEKKEDNPCFGRDTYAIGVNGEPVAMASLRSGDYVMDGPDSFTRVIVNQHAAVSFKSSLLLIGTEAATPLSITPDHVLSVDGKFVPARRVIVGSNLSEHEVVSVTLTTGAVINPLTASGKILTQGGILSSTYPEWIADYMLSSALFPLPFSVSNMLSYLFPEATQNYYDAVLEDFVTRHHPATLPKAAMPVAFILGDLAVSAGFVLFNLVSVKVLGALAAIACTAAAAKKK